MKRIFYLAILFTAVFSSCRFMGGKRVRGNGKITTQNRPIVVFNSVDVGGNIELYIKQDSVRSIRIEADENLLEYIIIKTEGNKLVVEPEDGYNLSGSNKIKVYVSSPEYKKLEASGASGITSESMLTSADGIDIDISGASDATLELKTPKISAELSGASSMTLKGETKNVSIDGEGASHARCFELMTENADVDVSGASSAQVFASVNLKGEASGASDITYKGAANYTGHASGASSVKKVE